ncbi:TonB-dependent receptor [termite gut metagenome]|uniref:TonB-dependent receptor n=1 Tax=termite gut metagenome TaxID=433724 RepID=A0A5J4QZH3_9ZZZZ
MKTFLSLSLSLFFLFNIALSAFAQSDSISRVYSLGEISVLGSKSGELLTDKVNETQFLEFNKVNLTEAANLLPGLTITDGGGGRNEGQIFLRGFGSLQTPIFYDGIPIYVPYDGNVDINRFTTFDLSQITVSKGLTSVLYGPNTMGGAINLVSRNPVKAFEVNGISSLKFSEKGLNGTHISANIGSKSEKFYVLGSFSYLDNAFLSLPKKFMQGTNEDGGRRENSDTEDLKFSAKVGYTPNTTDEYSFNVIIQNAQKGIPLGVNGNAQYRRYPEYNKNSVYYRSKTALGKTTSMSITAFYDNFYNIMGQYDDAGYVLQNKNNAFQSIYDDYSTGGSVNFSSSCFSNNLLKLSLYEKYDSHKEHNAAIAANEATGQNEKSGEPIQEYLDNTVSIGLEDVYSLNKSIDLIAGVNYSYRGNNQAQEYGTHYLTGEKDIAWDFPTGSDDAFNYQLAAVFTPIEHHEISLSASRKSRFATQKERYSSRFGTTVPNPDLASEFSWIFDLTYKGSIQSIFQYELSVFYNAIDNAIYAVSIPGEYQPDGITLMVTNQNVGKSFATGYEIALGYRPTNTLAFGANYSFIYRENRENKDLKFTDVPAHKAVLFGRFSLPNHPKVYLHIDWELNSKRYYTSTGETLPGFGLLNTKFSTKVWNGFSVEAGVKNIFDKEYSYFLNYPREGRTFLTSVVYDF